MAFDAFTRFPRAFSGRPALGRRIYEAMRNALGPSFNQEFNGSRVQARLYAQAMGMAAALRTLERVKKNAIALSATDLLGNLEALHGLVPRPGATYRERRMQLHARMQVLRGGRFEAVQAIMRSLLGDDFEDWVYASLSSLVRFPDTAAEAKLEGNYVPPGTQARVLRLLGPAFPGPQTVAVEEITLPVDGAQQPVGMTFLASPEAPGRREASTIDAVDLDDDGKITSVTAVFANAHPRGALLTTQYFPTWRSNAHHHLFVLKQGKAADLTTRRSVDAELARVLKSTARWSITEQQPAIPPTDVVVDHVLVGSGATPPTVHLSGRYDLLPGLRVEVLDYSSPAEPPNLGVGEIDVRVSLNGGVDWTAPIHGLLPWALEIPGAPGAFLHFPSGVAYSDDNTYEPVVDTVGGLPAGGTGPFRVGVGRLGVTTIGEV